MESEARTFELEGTSGKHPPEIDGVLVPFTIELSPIRRLLVIDVADDPTYGTLEPQVLDGPTGEGVLLLAYRHDGYVELYAPPELAVEEGGYDGLGKGVGSFQRVVFEQARFEVTDDGLQLDLAVAAPNGRRFDLHLHEHLSGGRDHFALLAPVGGSFETPTFFPFLWLPEMSFVPARGTEVDVRVEGRARSIARLPLPIGGRRCLMARYAEALVCLVNPDDGQTHTRRPAAGARTPSAPAVDVVDRRDGRGVAVVRVGRGDHTCAALFDPPLPDPRSLATHAQRSGDLLLQADDVTQLRGRYGLRRDGDRVELVVDRFRPWRTRTRRPLLAALFRLPVFRRWPTTYRWEATLDLGGEPELLDSRWIRRPSPATTGSADGQP